MDWDLASTLYYSDDPETLTTAVQGRREGVLFGFDILPNDQQRLLFYHVNGDRAPRYIAVRLFNMADTAVTVQYVQSLPAGSAAYLHVGHSSTAGFVRGLVEEDWRTVSVRPGQNVVLGYIEMDLEALAAGLVEFRAATGQLRSSVIAVSVF